MKRDMTEGNITSALLGFIIPLTAGNIFQQLYNIVDTFIVGHYLGSNALASVGAVSNLIFMFNAVMLGLKAGISVVASEDYGRRNYKDYKDTINVSKLLVITGILITVCIGLAGSNYLLRFVRVPEEVWKDSLLYFRIIMLGYPFLFLFNYGNALMQSIGNTKIVFLSLSTSTVINIIFDIVFIRALGMGVEGAALATVISQILLAIIINIALNKDIVMLEIKSKSFDGVQLFSKEKVKEILLVSFPAILQQGILAFGIISITALINQCGKEMIAGVAVSGKIESIISMPIVTIGEAMAVYTAQNVGAGKHERINQGLRSAMVICLIIGVSISGILIFKGKFFISLFLNQYDPAIIEKGYMNMMSILVMIFLMIPFRCFIGVCTGLKNMRAVVISFGLNIIARVICAYTLYQALREYAIYIANPFSVLVGAITVITIYIHENQRQKGMNTTWVTQQFFQQEH